MSQYLVTGGAGFIGSHLAEELTRRGHTCPRRRQPDHRQARQPRSRQGRRVSRRGPGRPGVRPSRGRGHRVRAAPGRDSLGAALGQGSDRVEPRQRGRDAERAGRRARRRRQAPGLRRVLVRVRQHADAAQARRHAEQSAVALRAPEGRRRAVPADVHAALRPRDGLDPLLQRLRSAPGSDRRRTPASSRCSRRRCSRTARRRSTATASRPATSPTSPTSSTACCARARRTGPAGK